MADCKGKYSHLHAAMHQEILNSEEALISGEERKNAGTISGSSDKFSIIKFGISTFEKFFHEIWIGFFTAVHVFTKHGLLEQIAKIDISLMPPKVKNPIADNFPGIIAGQSDVMSCIT